MKQADFFHLTQLQNQRALAGKSYLEFLRNPAMSAGVYVLPAGGDDAQNPHREDELYYVVQGRARIRVGTEERPVEAGSLIFVAAGSPHRFYDIAEDLTVLVFFAPAET